MRRNGMRLLANRHYQQERMRRASAAAATNPGSRPGGRRACRRGCGSVRGLSSRPIGTSAPAWPSRRQPRAWTGAPASAGTRPVAAPPGARVLSPRACPIYRPRPARERRERHRRRHTLGRGRPGCRGGSPRTAGARRPRNWRRPLWPVGARAPARPRRREGAGSSRAQAWAPPDVGLRLLGPVGNSAGACARLGRSLLSASHRTFGRTLDACWSA